MENEENLKQTLRLLYEQLKGINYVFIGSVNLYLQGMSVSPRDIDILTSPDEIVRIDEVLKSYQTKEIYFDESDGRNSFRSFYEINGYEIEVLGNVNNAYRKSDYSDDTILINYDSNDLSCMSLSAEAETYKKMGRVEKAKMIEEFIEKHKIVEAVKCILINNDGNKILLVKQVRDKDDLWVFPGGKLENDETIESCAHREMREELNITLTELKNIGKLQTTWEKEKIIFHCFVCQVEGDTSVINEREIKEAKWFLLGELPDLGPTTKMVLEMWQKAN